VLPRRDVATAIALLGGTAATAATVGQATGGLVSDSLGFRWIFWIALMVGGGASIGLALVVPESPVRTPARIDLPGALLLAPGLGLPLFGISQASAAGWGAARTLLPLGVGVACLAIFAAWERRHPQPLIDISTLVQRDVALTNLATMLAGFGIFSSLTILSQFFQEPRSTGYGLGANPTQAGLFLVPGAALLFLSSPLAGRLSTNVGPRVTLLVGAGIGALGLQGVTFVHQARFEMYLWPTVICLGLGFVFSAVPTLILQCVPVERSGQSTAINVTTRNVGSALGIQVAATLVSMRVGSSGHPAEQGYRDAFELLALAALAAVLVGFVIPRRRDTRVEETDTIVAIDLASS
jgi:MFS family permease